MIFLVIDTLKVLFKKVSVLSDSVRVLHDIRLQNNHPPFEYGYWIAGIITLGVVIFYARQVWKQSKLMTSQSKLMEAQTKSMEAQTNNLLEALLTFTFEKSGSIDELELKYSESNNLYNYIKATKFNAQLTPSLFPIHNASEPINATEPINVIDPINPTDSEEKYYLIIKNHGNCAVSIITFNLSLTIEFPAEPLKKNEILGRPSQQNLIIPYNIVNQLQARETVVKPITYKESFSKCTMEIKGHYIDIRGKEYDINVIKQIDENSIL